MPSKPRPRRVGLLMGSQSDWEIMQEAAAILDRFGVPYDVEVCSIHRTPERARAFAQSVERKGFAALIGGAGFAAHLAGYLAGKTILPVLGVPLPSSPLGGIDALLSTVQMPGGIPVATFGVGKSGARNAGLFAAQILALTDAGLARKLKAYRKAQTDKVTKASRQLKATLKGQPPS